jgi:hypothetical protein
MRQADVAVFLLGEIAQGGVWWDDPEDRAWLLDHLAWIERAAFRWSPRRCGRLREAMGFELDLAAVYVRLEEARDVLLGPATRPSKGKGWKIRKGRKFLQRKKFTAWRVKWRRFAKHPLHRAARWWRGTFFA